MYPPRKAQAEAKKEPTPTNLEQGAARGGPMGNLRRHMRQRPHRGPQLAAQHCAASAGISRHIAVATTCTKYISRTGHTRRDDDQRGDQPRRPAKRRRSRGYAPQARTDQWLIAFASAAAPAAIPQGMMCVITPPIQATNASAKKPTITNQRTRTAHSKRA